MEIEKSQENQKDNTDTTTAERERSRNIAVYQELAAKEPAEAEKQLQFLLDEKWQHRKSDVEMVMTLIESRSNIYMHGPNGSGKTTFVHDCFKTKRFEIPYIYIDTIEFYSEKLIAISISQQINGILQSYAT
jgi:Cdc6-like AAA superfamily ATPase